MRKRLVIGFIVSTFSIFGACSAYADEIASETAPQTEDSVVCKQLPPPTGSRLGGRTICQKASVWEAQRRLAEQELVKAQANNLNSNLQGKNGN